MHLWKKVAKKEQNERKVEKKLSEGSLPRVDGLVLQTSLFKGTQMQI